MGRVRLALIVSEFNSEITSQMMERAKEYAKKWNAELRYIFKVPGSYEVPLIAKLLAEREDVDAIATLGAIIKGETKHDEVIANSIAYTLSEIALKYEKPITLGISGPGMSEEQAYNRIDEYARRAVESAIKLCNRIGKFKVLKLEGFPQIIE